MFQKLLHTLSEYQTIIIHRHSRPDGDALGSQIGLKELIRENFPDKMVYIVGDPAGYLSFMEGSRMDEISDSVYEGALAVVLDASSPGIVSDQRFSLASCTARMDHHILQGAFTDVEVIDDSFESCCGMIAYMAMEHHLRVNRLAAKSLYTGLLTDSGRFRYDSTTARTFRIAAFLRESNFEPEEIFRDLYAESFENKKLRAQFLLKTKFTKNRVAYIVTDRAELAAMDKDVFTVSRGMVNVMADLKGVGAWVNITETNEGVICELRSAEKNINPIAVKYGGGGHAKACGATVADLNTAMALLQELDQMMEGTHEE